MTTIRRHRAVPRPVAARSPTASPTCSARMTLDEKLAQLGSAWVFQLADRRPASTPSAAAPLLADGIGHITRISGASSLTRGRGGGARQRDPAPPDRAHPARHPGHRPRGDLRRADGARGHRVPAGDRRGGTFRPELNAERSPTRSGCRCGRSAPTRACRRCSTSAATRGGAGSRRPTARTRTS